MTECKSSVAWIIRPERTSYPSPRWSLGWKEKNEIASWKDNIELNPFILLTCADALCRAFSPRFVAVISYPRRRHFMALPLGYIILGFQPDIFYIDWLSVQVSHVFFKTRDMRFLIAFFKMCPSKLAIKTRETQSENWKKTITRRFPFVRVMPFV